MEHFDCIVIGGGVSGLVSASRLAAGGCSVRVLEAEDRLGGCIRSWRPREDFWLELGAHTAYNSYAPLLEALDERGRLEDLLPREKVGYRFVEADGSLKSPLARLNFLEAAMHLPFGLLRAKSDQSVMNWFSGLLGRGNYRRLLAPAFAAVLSQPADDFPATWLFRKKPRMQRAPRKYTFTGGLQGLLEALAADAPYSLRTGALVGAISASGNGFRVETGDTALTCSQLVLAVPVDVAARLLAELYPEVARRLASFPMSESEAMGVVLPADKTALPPLAGLIGADDSFWSVVTRDPVPHQSLRGYTFHFRPGVLDRVGKLARIAQVLGTSPDAFLHVEEALNRLPAPTVEHVALAGEVLALLAPEPLALVGNYLNGLAIGDCAERAVIESARLLKMKGMTP
ncbi:MAG: FAD-dependent oxidoreductase [Pseudomonadota bacterium]|nr:FAD-dependent oxidoreductase [Pseudomonadota bacterium]MDP1903357.1 FAD-dependent oxidoreductase [Pseudomonadota bacterium]MDP2352327.1 FAD-dependent oxidoreductase [Pseudomonadota bacterium]